MKRKRSRLEGHRRSRRSPTPAQVTAALAHLTRWETRRTPTQDIQWNMVLTGWTDPQPVTIDNRVYVAAMTGTTAIFITGEEGAYQITLAGHDLTVSADLRLPRIPSPGVIYEIWRLLNLKEK